MRVVMLLGRSTGGIGTHVVELVAGLRDLGAEVEVVTDPLTAEQFGIADARLWWPRRDRGASAPGDLRRLRHLAAGADVVHAHGHQAGVVGALTAGRTPLVVSQHNAVLAGGLRGYVGEAAQRFVTRRAALVTGASSDLVDEALRLGARRAELAPVPSPRVPGLLAEEPLSRPDREAAARDLLHAEGIELPAGEPVVVSVARIAPQKDLRTLVDAWRDDLGTWVVVGGGDEPLRRELVARAAARGARVHLVGSQPDPGRWLRAAEAFVLTSLWEARALVVQEALAAGTPVVATDTGGLHDLVEGVGALVPVGDPPAVAAALATYVDDPQAREDAVRAGRERAGSWDDGPQTARRWRAVYEALPDMT